MARTLNAGAQVTEIDPQSYPDGVVRIRRKGDTNDRVSIHEDGSVWAGDGTTTPTVPPLPATATASDQAANDNSSKIANTRYADTIKAFVIQRANHTGTQTLATISDAGTAAAANTGTGAGNVPTTAQADARYDAAGAAAAAQAAAISTAEAFSIQRANHTGTQAESTVTGLVADLAGKAPKRTQIVLSPSAITSPAFAVTNISGVPINQLAAAANSFASWGAIDIPSYWTTYHIEVRGAAVAATGNVVLRADLAWLAPTDALTVTNAAGGQFTVAATTTPASYTLGTGLAITAGTLLTVRILRLSGGSDTLVSSFNLVSVILVQDS